MTYTEEQVEAAGAIARLHGDPWEIGAEASHLKSCWGLRDEDIVAILAEDYGKEVSSSTIQSTRQVYEVFGADPVASFKFSHHKAALHAARDITGLRGRHNLSDDERDDLREVATMILQSVKIPENDRVTKAVLDAAIAAVEHQARPTGTPSVGTPHSQEQETAPRDGSDEELKVPADEQPFTIQDSTATASLGAGGTSRALRERRALERKIHSLARALAHEDPEEMRWAAGELAKVLDAFLRALPPAVAVSLITDTLGPVLWGNPA